MRGRFFNRNILKIGSVLLAMLLAIPSDFSVSMVKGAETAAYAPVVEMIPEEENFYGEGLPGVEMNGFSEDPEEIPEEVSDFAWMEGFTEEQLKAVPLEEVAVVEEEGTDTLFESSEKTEEMTGFTDEPGGEMFSSGDETEAPGKTPPPTEQNVSELSGKTPTLIEQNVPELSGESTPPTEPDAPELSGESTPPTESDAPELSAEPAAPEGFQTPENPSASVTPEPSKAPETPSASVTPEPSQTPENPADPELEKVSEVTLKIQEGEDLTLPLNTLLLKVSDYATDEKPYKVIIPPGKYNLTGTVCTYSNIHLYASGATITKTSTKKHILLRLGNKEESQGGYDGYRNVTIEGGTWDCNYEVCEGKEEPGGFVGFRIGHVTNVTVKDVTFLNNLKSHFLELGGVKNAHVTGCKFSGYWKPCEDRGQECIQIDCCLDEIFPRYQPYDGTVCEDIIIEGNEFTDVFAGLGSHSMMFNKPYERITIQNNHFSNVKKRGIWCLNYKDSVVRGNVLEHVAGGIYVASMRYTHAHLLEGQTSSVKQNQASQNVEVSNNQIIVSPTGTINGSVWTSYGIVVGGQRNPADSTGIAKGLYIIRGVTVKDNTISGCGEGIHLQLANLCTVTGNKVTMSADGKYLNSGISVDAGKSNTLSGNQIENAPGYGMYIGKGAAVYNTSSTGNAVTGNTVTGSAGTGIMVDVSSDKAVVTGNTLQNCKNRGIVIKKSVIRELSGNRILSGGNTGIYVLGSTVKALKSNVIRGGAGAYSIYMKNCSGKTVTLKSAACSQVKSGALKVTGRVTGGKTIVISRRSDGKRLGSGKLGAKGGYTVKIAAQKKGRVLILTVTDQYGNKSVRSTKVV